MAKKATLQGEKATSIEFVDKISQRIRMDALRLSNALTDGDGNIPVFDVTMLKNFRVYFSILSINGDKKNVPNIKADKEPRKSLVNFMDKWDDDWDLFVAVFDKVFSNDGEEVRDFSKNFQIEETGSTTQIESDTDAESLDSSKQDSLVLN